MLHSLVVSQEHTCNFSRRYHFPERRSARCDDRVRADIGGEGSDGFFQSIGEVRFSKCQEQGPPEGLGEDDQGYAHRALVLR